VAVAYLRRALAEPPDQDARVDVLVELGRTEAQLPVAHDFSALREALELAPTPERRAAVAEELISALLGAPDNPAAHAIAERVLASGDLDPARLTRLEGHLIGAGAPDLAAVDRILARARPLFERVMSDEAADPVMLGALAMAGAVAGYQASDVARLAERAVRDDRLLKWHRALNGASGALAWTDRLDAAAAAQDVGLAVAQQRGNLSMFTGLSVFRADTAFRAGELALAEAHGRRAFELGHELGLDAFALMWLLGIVMERDGPREAAALLEPLDLSEPLLGVWHGVVCLAQRGRIRFGLGDFQRGLDDLLAADRRMSEHHLYLSVLIDWVPIATTALAQVGRIDEARELAARELADAAAFGAARRHGIALSVAGRLEAGDRGLGLLREAVDLLESSPARLEHARALMNLGIGLRERGERKTARTPLAAALDIAHRCGGNLLAEQAREALVAAGARPRRNMLTGPEALTPAEARIARLAADGQTNREIAQALFLSVKTVEWQLSHAYAKLRVARRGELADALHPPLARSHDDRGARIETPG
jgi:DNA-binding CsgD family transcriptional regulator